jgi:hypothetical protein
MGCWSQADSASSRSASRVLASRQDATADCIPPTASACRIAPPTDIAEWRSPTLARCPSPARAVVVVPVRAIGNGLTGDFCFEDDLEADNCCMGLGHQSESDIRLQRGCLRPCLCGDWLGVPSFTVAAMLSVEDTAAALSDAARQLFSPRDAPAASPAELLPTCNHPTRIITGTWLVQAAHSAAFTLLESKVEGNWGLYSAAM